MDLEICGWTVPEGFLEISGITLSGSETDLAVATDSVPSVERRDWRSKEKSKNETRTRRPKMAMSVNLKNRSSVTCTSLLGIVAPPLQSFPGLWSEPQRCHCTYQEHSKWEQVFSYDVKNFRANRGIRSVWVAALMVMTLAAHPPSLRAVDWPWKAKKPHQLIANCSLDTEQVEQNTQRVLKARVEANDTHGHRLSYGWSANAGRIEGKGADAEIDISSLNPGTYGIAAIVKDNQGKTANCTAQFRIIPPPNELAITCGSQPEAVEASVEIILQAVSSDRLGRKLRHSWTTNGGSIMEQIGKSARLDTTGLLPGEYQVSGRVEDDMGIAADCAAIFNIKLKEVPAILEPANVAQVLFLRNQSAFDLSGQESLKKVIERAKKEAVGTISIEGYGDPDETNPEQLASERAELVKQYLVQNGIEESRVQVLVGIGGRLGGSRNRMVDVIWIPDGLEY